MAESWRYGNGSDKVDEHLIWIISKLVKLDKLEQLSAYLRIKEHVHNDIITSFRNEPLQQKFRVRPVADLGFPRGWCAHPRGGGANLLFDQFFPKTA